MQKQAPSIGRILSMVMFALSCFGLLLFLWLSFGGGIPFKPQGYRMQVAFPEASQLGLEADVRMAGVRIGKVRSKELDPRDGNRTLATIELERRYAPIPRDARAIVRQKTLLGETYVEITPGTRGSKMLPENGRLANGQVAPTVELDEIVQALDPTTREAFHVWQQQLATAIDRRGQGLSDAFGNLPGFVGDGSDLLKVLHQQSGHVSRLVSNGGTVFEALTRNEGQLRGLIVNSGQVFAATAAQNEALAQTFSIFPTFLDETRATFADLEEFSVRTDPLIRDLQPVARELRPTLRSVRLLAPDLRRLFRDLSPLVSVARRGLPALRDTLRGASPLLAATGPFLQQLNPILQFLEYYQRSVSMFIMNGSFALWARRPSASGGVGHYLRQVGPIGPENLSLFPTRTATNRGNAYLPPLATNSFGTQQNGIQPLWDCVPSGGPVRKSPTPPPSTPGAPGTPPCWLAGPIPTGDQPRRYPHVTAVNYGR
jgi:phospholipid/cholesterol/gamma-HCH transport system substrate-binding protein